MKDDSSLQSVKYSFKITQTVNLPALEKHNGKKMHTKKNPKKKQKTKKQTKQPHKKSKTQTTKNPCWSEN